MEKIIYNTKMRKILVLLLVVMLMMSYIMPIKVFAGSKAEDLKSVLESTDKYGQPAFGFLPGQVNLQKCQDVINKIYR